VENLKFKKIEDSELEEGQEIVGRIKQQAKNSKDQYYH
jgi:hypothetical protein